MILSKDLKNKLSSGEYAETLAYIYGTDKIGSHKYSDRYLNSIEQFESVFGEKKELRLFSAPGRTEVCGNHTDHQHGRVLAAGVNIDIIAVVSKNDTNIINIKSEGYEIINIDLNDMSVHKDEYNTTISLVRGISAAFKNIGYTIGGFDAYMTSDVLKGSGLSSSAAFEVIIGTIINEIFCNGNETAIKIAQIGQYSENLFFGKPCGLMDQMASSVGGFVTIDFKDNENPIVEKVDFNFAESGFRLCIVDTGGNHVDLTPDYASIPYEMGKIANHFGKNFLVELDKQEFYKNIKTLRERYGDRAVLRATHFYSDDERVPLEVEALKNNDFNTFKNIVLESGISSFTCLQNVFSCSAPGEQGISLALSICSRVLGSKGAYRVHGGGFAGTMQAFVPEEILSEFKTEMENVFGSGKCYVLSIRPVGGIEIK